MLKVDNSIKPVILPARRIPRSYFTKTIEGGAIDDLIKEKIITTTIEKYTEWVKVTFICIGSNTAQHGIQAYSNYTK